MNIDLESPAERYLRCAHECRARDLRRLSVLCTLVKTLSELVHALQKERGASSIYLGSSARNFSVTLKHQVIVSLGLERLAADQLETVDSKLETTNLSARFYSSVGYALLALDNLPGIRLQVEALGMESEEAVRSFSDVIAALLAVEFETADIAGDANTARALIALVNLSQGKEYAGQERAVGSSILSRGQAKNQEKECLRRLAASQQQAFRVFAEFAAEGPAEDYRQLATSDDTRLIETYRTRAFEFDGSSDLGADAWYALTTRRIDALKSVEENLSEDLERLCHAKIQEAEFPTQHSEADPPAPVAMLVAGLDDLVALSRGSAILLPADDALPAPLHSIRTVIEAQSRQIRTINSELSSVRRALAERKLVERAKGLLMERRRLSENNAYALMRQTAMNQNKRLAEVAESIVSAAELLQELS